MYAAHAFYARAIFSEASIKKKNVHLGETASCRFFVNFNNLISEKGFLGKMNFSRLLKNKRNATASLVRTLD